MRISQLTETMAGVSSERAAEARRAALRQILRENNIPPAQLARQAGLRRANAIYNFLNGGSASLSVITIAQIGAALPGVDLTGLILPGCSGPGTRIQYSRTELVGPVKPKADMPLHRSSNGATTRSVQNRRLSPARRGARRQCVTQWVD